MSDRVEFRKIREFGQIINDTVLFIKQNFRPMMKVFFYICGLFIIASTLISIMQQMGARDFIKNAGTNGELFSGMFDRMFTLSSLLSVVFMFAYYTAIAVAIQCFVVLYVEKGNIAPSVEEVWAYFKYYYFRIFGSNILLSLFFLAAFVCCIVPAIYVFPAISLFPAIMMSENASFGYSISRGFKLLKDQWWSIAATLVIIWIITYAAMFLVYIPALIGTMLSAFSPESDSLSMLAIIFSSVTQHLAQIFLVIPLIGISLCYFNLVERQENTGLLDRINQFGTIGADLNSTKEEY